MEKAKYQKKSLVPNISRISHTGTRHHHHFPILITRSQEKTQDGSTTFS